MAKMHIHLSAVLFLVLAIAAGCATIKTTIPPLTIEGSTQALQTGDIVDTRRGTVISFETLIDDLSKATVIYLGETHTSIEDHQIQRKILAGLYARNPHLIVALEMFPRAVQPVLDGYSEGAMEEKQFLKDVGWNAVWGYPFQLYRGILSWARERQLKLVGLNAPPNVVRKIARTGISSLSVEERQQIATHMNFADAGHRAYIREEYEQHLKHNIKGFDSYYQAQLAWEETMAETLAATLKSLQSSDQIVVLVGKGHIVHQFGVPQRTFERIGQPYKTVVPIPSDHPHRTIDPGLADYLWVTGKSTEFKHPRMLGVMLNTSAGDNGLSVMQVLPGSAAARAGLKKGDVLRAIDGSSINSVEDIHGAVAQERKTEYRLRIERNGKELELPVTFPPITQMGQ
ncbi:ChaN family lipoprotein [Desulfoferrobacter suflitae]|uniref:ChaN family lipoprotein n=1 Tax=Desulfoferrobacter suflitae TaxID=2865782 RepID=UPI002164176A|nr:ChaN family lipoprotein [Desulfoferrobacter suflitae]MCK8600967.1 ChaN family lipoprotein [Desulfoferrobacter suflitae]